MKPTVSIIIPTLNEEQYLPALLHCIKKQTIESYEVIVADAGSEDRTREIARKFGAKVVKGGRPAHGRNAGVNSATSNLYLFLDADITFDTDFLNEAITLFKKSDCSIANFKIKAPQGTKSITARLNYFLYNFVQPLTFKTPIPITTGGCVLINKKTFDSLGGFNENIKRGEDFNFGKRALQKGLRIKVLPVSVFLAPRNFSNFKTIFQTFWRYLKGTYLHKWFANTDNVALSTQAENRLKQTKQNSRKIV